MYSYISYFSKVQFGIITYLVTGHGVWIDNQIYWSFKELANYDKLRQSQYVTFQRSLSLQHTKFF
jgi:hypothetical protein